MYHHHTQEEKQAAIDLYISSGCSPAAVLRTLGYPNRSTMLRRYDDYLRRGYVRGPARRPGKFTEAQRQRAVEQVIAKRKLLAIAHTKDGLAVATLISPNKQTTMQSRVVINRDEIMKKPFSPTFSQALLKL